MHQKNNTRGSVGWACVAHLSFCFEEPFIQNLPYVLPTKFQFHQRRYFSNSTRNKNCLWWPCLLMDRGEMGNLYRGPSIDASYQVLVHLAKRFQMRRFLQIDQSETRIACGSHVCKCPTDRNKMWNLYKGPSIDASY